MPAAAAGILLVALLLWLPLVPCTFYGDDAMFILRAHEPLTPYLLGDTGDGYGLAPHPPLAPPLLRAWAHPQLALWLLHRGLRSALAADEPLSPLLPRTLPLC